MLRNLLVVRWNMRIVWKAFQLLHSVNFIWHGLSLTHRGYCDNNCRTKSFNYKTIQLQNSSTTKQFNYETIQLRNNSSTKQFNYEIIQLRNNSTTKQFNYWLLANCNKLTSYRNFNFLFFKTLVCESLILNYFK